MKPKYTATVYVETGEGEFLEHSADNLQQLLSWINAQAEKSAFNVKGEIVDNHKQQVVQRIHYTL